MERVCRNCKYCYSNETIDGLYICTNGDSEILVKFVDICSNAECAACITGEEEIFTETPNYWGEH